jgi:hypothetical protein
MSNDVNSVVFNKTALPTVNVLLLPSFNCGKANALSSATGAWVGFAVVSESSWPFWPLLTTAEELIVFMLCYSRFI